MKISFKYSAFFRYLALIALCEGIALIILTGMGIKWVVISRVIGMYFGVFFLPIALLELLAFIAERYAPERHVAISTVVTSLVWTLLILALSIIVVVQLSPSNPFSQTSDMLYRFFPNEFLGVFRGSVMVICIWLVPLSILSGLMTMLKRWREQDIQQALILLQVSVFAVALWMFFFQKMFHRSSISIVEIYFNPFRSDYWGADASTVIPIISFTAVLLFWCALFLVFRTVIKYCGFRATTVGFSVALVPTTAYVFLMRVPTMMAARGVDFVNFSGWYPFRLPHLVPLRIWVASILFAGLTVCVAVAYWYALQKKTTTRSLIHD